MKLNRLINNANIILNQNILKKNYFNRNQSFMSSSNNNDISKSNVSITTNASLARINSPRNFNIINRLNSPKPYNIKIKFDKGLSHSGSVGMLSPTPSRINFEQNIILEKADNIIKERLKSNGKQINKKYEKNVAIKLSKDISLKNYVINLLKIKRTQINDKERVMNNALMEFTNQFNFDYKTFTEYIEDVKRRQKLEEDLINKLKIKREEKENVLNEEMFKFRRLEDSLDKLLRQLYNTYIYSNFVHIVFEIPFNYKDMPELNRNRKMEEISDIIIKIYETKDINAELPSVLKEDDLLIQKFVQMEDKIIHRIQNRDLLLKEVDKCNEIYKRELKFLENSLKEYEKDYDYLKHDLFLISKSMNNLKIQEDKKIEEHFEFIIDLGKEITQKMPRRSLKNNINGYLGYCKNVLKTLEEKEVSINNYINEIELILNYGEKDDKILVEKCISDIKKINKKENQLRIKKKQEELENEKNMKNIRRAQRIVVKGRKVATIFPSIKHVRKIKKINLNNDDNEIECVYSVTDEEK